MIEYLKDYKDNALAITDEQVASDWRLGLVRSVAKIVALQAAPLDSMGRFGTTVAGSNREHILGNWSTVARCSLVEIYDLKEEAGEEYNFSTFGSTSDNVMVLTANATCKCGKLVKHPVSMNMRPGELIYSVMTADAE